jgi:hypothetical protein
MPRWGCEMSTERREEDSLMRRTTNGRLTKIRGVDWRGWIALAWVLFWGLSYCGMVVQARGQRIMDWFRPRQAVVASEEPERGHRTDDPALLTTVSESKRQPSSVQAR